jgi:transcription initiation factor TFIIIB Brf1 subunit/transcription initiation factor TFIIB
MHTSNRSTHPVSSPSRLASVADAVLRTQGTTLEIWLADRREVRRTYRELADELAEKTDGMVKVSHEAIRRWCRAYGIEDDRGAA